VSTRPLPLRTCIAAGAVSSLWMDVPPLCDAQNPLQQDYAKAYPTIRELTLAQELGAQGIVSSLCPIDVVDNAAGNDPL
jgi:hypothetical protein